jgi:MFS family permease
MTTGLAPQPRSRPRRTERRIVAALASPTLRTYLFGQGLAYLGNWMQAIALDWLVLVLTRSATAVGVTMALQFLPVLLLSMYGGLLADRYPKRQILLLTQTLTAVLTALMAALTLTGHIAVVEIYVFALVGGVIAAFDTPARQVFVTEVAPAAHLREAIALNAAVFQASRLVAPALATTLIATAGTGWVFAANTLCLLGPITSLLLIGPVAARAETAVRTDAAERARLRDALAYVAQRPRLAWTIFLAGILGTFGLNFPIVLTGMAGQAFHAGVGDYGLFNAAVAVGSVTGALGAGTFPGRRLWPITMACAGFGVLQAAASVAPTVASFLVLLVLMGVVNLVFQAMAASSVQLWTDPALRGRVMGLYVLVFIGGTPIGGPLVGYVCQHYGARTAMALCGVLPALAAAVVAASRFGATRAARAA